MPWLPQVCARPAINTLCWMTFGGSSNASNELFPDAVRFPNGIKALAYYIHAKGLKPGIYSDAASLTCGGVTGSYNFEEHDATTFAKWGIEYLKYDY